MATTRRPPRFRLWTMASGAGLLAACNAVLGMDELPRAPDAASGQTGSGASSGDGSDGSDGGAAGSDNTGGVGGKAGSSGNGGGGEGGSNETPQVCMPDSRECVDGRALHCNEDGTDFVSEVECRADQTCLDGTCHDQQCEPGTSFCSGREVLDCAADGLSSTAVEMCGANEYCDAASAECKEGACAPNELACDDNVATTCNSDGSGYVAGGMPCGEDTTCQDGVCKPHVCTPDAVTCQSQQLQRCASNGLTSTIVETCDADEYCTTQNGGSCPKDVCVQGTRTCSGNTSKLCNATGSGTTDTTCSGGFCDSSSGSCRTPGELAGELDGRLIQIPCSDSTNTDDCNARIVVDGVSTECSGADLITVLDHPIGGTPGTVYRLTIHFYGIIEPRNYGANVIRESGMIRPDNLVGGASPAPWATADPGVTFRASDYSSYEIHVLDEDMNEQAQYFVNSDTQEGHYSYVLNFERTIDVIGGGVVRLRYFDDNCRIIKNCNGGVPCAGRARTVDVSAASPQPVLTQPGLGRPTDQSGQWLLFDVTAAAQ